MTTARTLIKSALRKIAVLGTGQSLSAEDAVDALSALNTMIASWSVEGDMIYYYDEETFPLIVGVTDYQIGPGQTFNTVRPIEVIAAYVREGGNDTSLAIRGLQDWSIISDKDQTGTPREIYYDGNHPNGKIRLWPAPSQSSSITIFSKKPLTKFSSLDAEFSFPAEYERALIYNLAIEVAPEYEREPSATVMRTAAKSKAVIQNQNTANDLSLLRVDDSLIGTGSFNIFTGTGR